MSHFMGSVTLSTFSLLGYGWRAVLYCLRFSTLAWLRLIAYSLHLPSILALHFLSTLFSGSFLPCVRDFGFAVCVHLWFFSLFGFALCFRSLLSIFAFCSFASLKFALPLKVDLGLPPVNLVCLFGHTRPCGHALFSCLVILDLLVLSASCSRIMLLVIART